MTRGLTLIYSPVVLFCNSNEAVSRIGRTKNHPLMVYYVNSFVLSFHSSLSSSFPTKTTGRTPGVTNLETSNRVKRRRRHTRRGPSSTRFSSSGPCVNSLRPWCLRVLVPSLLWVRRRKTSQVSVRTTGVKGISVLSRIWVTSLYAMMVSYSRHVGCRRYGSGIFERWTRSPYTPLSLTAKSPSSPVVLSTVRFTSLPNIYRSFVVIKRNNRDLVHTTLS